MSDSEVARLEYKLDELRQKNKELENKLESMAIKYETIAVSSAQIQILKRRIEETETDRDSYKRQCHESQQKSATLSINKSKRLSKNVIC